MKKFNSNGIEKNKNKSKKSNYFVPDRGDLKEIEFKLNQGTFIVFDIENTGGNPEKNGITEICALKVFSGEIVDTFYTLVNPKMPIPPIVRKMTGITNRMVKNSPTIDEVMPDFVDFIGDYVLVSHNTIGDIKFLRYFSKEVVNVNLLNYFLCTHLLSEKLLSSAPDKSLKGLVDFIGFKGVEDFHRAHDDAYATKALFEHLIVKLKKNNIHIIKDAIRFQGDLESALRLGWGIDDRMFMNLTNDIGVYKLIDRHGKVLFFSATDNVKNDLYKLRSFNDLPKQLLKSILPAVRFEVKKFDSLIEAFLWEAKLLIKHNIRYSLINWNQRSGKFLYLIDTNGITKLVLGPLVKASYCVFGPILNEKECYDILAAISKFQDTKLYSNSVLVEGPVKKKLEEYYRGSAKSFEINGNDFEGIRFPDKVRPLNLFSGIYLSQNKQKYSASFVYKGILIGKTKKWVSNWWILKILMCLKTLKWRLREFVYLVNSNSLVSRYYHHINRASWWVVQGGRQKKGVFIPLGLGKPNEKISAFLKH